MPLMDRRRFVAMLGLGVSSVSGCIGSEPGGNETDTARSGVEETVPSAQTTADASATTTVDPATTGAETTDARIRSSVPGSWPQVGHDARNTSFAPGATGPRGDVSIAWTAIGDRSVFRPVVGEQLYLTENWTDGRALSLDSADGSKRWANADLPPMRWAPALHGDRVLVITRTESNEGRLHALDVATGEKQWVSMITASSSKLPTIGPTVADDRIYIGSDTGVIALDAVSGEKVWKTELKKNVVETGDGPIYRTVWAKPAVTDTHVYTFDRNNSY
jgi:hypothetical protein